MKKLFFSFIFLIVANLICTQILAQVIPAPILKDWQMIGESASHIDVSYRIVRCNNANVIQLKLFNESNVDQTVEFDITVTNKFNLQNFSKTFSVAVPTFQTRQGECIAGKDDELKIILPDAYYALNLDVKITFKQ